MEAITLEFVRSLLEMKSMGVAADRIFVIGGGAGSPLWRQMVADASGLPVIRSLSNEASALGAGMSAAVGAGWYGHFSEAADAMSRLAEQVEPRAATAEAWAALSRRQANLYHAVRHLDHADNGT
jgi:xylulokinase